MNVFCGLEFLPYTPSTISLLSATIVLVPISWYTNVCMNISVVLGPKLGPATEDAIGDITSSARTLSTLENSVAIKASINQKLAPLHRNKSVQLIRSICKKKGKNHTSFRDSSIYTAGYASSNRFIVSNGLPLFKKLDGKRIL